MRRLAISLLSITLTLPVFAGTESGADFLKIPIGARALAMGQAFTALTDESNALNWNVAGIAPRNPDSALGHFSFSHQLLLLENSLDHASVSFPQGVSGLGLSVTRLSYPSQDARDTDRNRTGSFGASDLSAGLAYAASYGSVRVGTQVKYLQQSIANQNASGFAMDFGVLSRTALPRLNVGLSVRNLGPSMQFVSEQFHLPLMLTTGGAYRISGPLLLAADLQHRPYDHQTSVSIGSEFSATGSFALRAGYITKIVSAVSNSQKQETNRGVIGGVAGMNVGFGLKFSSLVLDYAMSPFGELGDIQSLTLSSSFGGNTARSKKGGQKKSTSPEPLDASSERSIVIFDQQPGDSTPWVPSK